MNTFGKLQIITNRLALNPSYLGVVDHVEYDNGKYILNIARNDYYYVNYAATEDYKHAVIRQYIDHDAVEDTAVNKDAFFNLVDPVKVERHSQDFADTANAGTQDNEDTDNMLDEVSERIEEEYFDTVGEDAPNFAVRLTGDTHIFEAQDFIDLWEEEQRVRSM